LTNGKKVSIIYLYLEKREIEGKWCEGI